MVDKKGRELARLMLDEHLKLRAAAEKRIEVVGAEGVERGAARDSERHLVGRVSVPRLAYQASGAQDLHPLDASLNFPREMFCTGSGAWWQRRSRALRRRGRGNRA